MKSVVVLLSGGLHSAIALHAVIKSIRQRNVIALHLQNMNASAHQQEHAAAIADDAGVDFLVKSYSGGLSQDARKFELPILLSLACSYFVEHFVKQKGTPILIATGIRETVNETRRVPVDFMETMVGALQLAYGWDLLVDCPLFNLSDKELFKDMTDLGPDCYRAVNMSYSCSLGHLNPCTGQNECDRCTDRRAIFKVNGVPDLGAQYISSRAEGVAPTWKARTSGQNNSSI